MSVALAFDVYGTLIDTQGVVAELEKHIGCRASEFALAWRAKQLEYSFRRGLMRRYEDFGRCTKEAFHHTLAVQKVAVSAATEELILGAYERLPAFAEARESMACLRAAGYRMFAFSNGLPAVVHTLLLQAGIRDFFEDVVSVDEIKSFKPDPAVYHHFLARARATAAETWLISSNPFDVIGAISAGMRAAWVRRAPAVVFDPWGIEPTITVPTLAELSEKLRNAH